MSRATKVAGGSASLLALAWAGACAFVYRRAFGRRYIDPRMTTPDDYGAVLREVYAILDDRHPLKVRAK